MSYADKTRTCRDCGETFVFTAQEQEFFASKGFDKPPSRCPSCRQARKGGGNQSKSTRQNTREMFDAICATCGRETQVPFLPRPDRPVYCRDCHEEHKRGGGFFARCDECGAPVTLKFEPAPDKWIRCDQCHAEHRSRQMNRQWGGSGDGTSSRKTRDIMGNIVDKPSTYSVGPGASMPIDRSHRIPGIPGSFPKGGKKRGPKY